MFISLQSKTTSYLKCRHRIPLKQRAEKQVKVKESRYDGSQSDFIRGQKSRHCKRRVEGNADVLNIK